MINPIQQNVVFKGVNANSVNGKADNFTGSPVVAPVVKGTSVREDYLNAVKKVSSVQESMNKLNVIA